MEVGIDFYVNSNYLFPLEEMQGRGGLPEIRKRIEWDVETLRIQKELASILPERSYGWCRVLPEGKGKILIDTLGDLAPQAWSILDRIVEEWREEWINRSMDSLDLGPNGEVYLGWKILGKVGTARWPTFLDNIPVYEPTAYLRRSGS